MGSLALWWVLVCVCLLASRSVGLCLGARARTFVCVCVNMCVHECESACDSVHGCVGVFVWVSLYVI